MATKCHHDNELVTKAVYASATNLKNSIVPFLGIIMADKIGMRTDLIFLQFRAY